MKFPKSSFFRLAVNHSIFRNIVSHDQTMKMVKFHLLFGITGIKSATGLYYQQNFPSSICHSCKYGVFAISVLVSGKILLKSSQITTLVKIHKILVIVFTAYILGYLVNTCCLICMHCTYHTVLCK